MSNIFAMVTIKNTNHYTDYALKSFFKNTPINDDDDFFLIDNDGCETDRFSTYGKIKIIKKAILVGPPGFEPGTNTL